MLITLKTLRGFKVFDGLTDHELEMLAEFADEETFSKGTRIFPENAVADKIYLIAEGKVSIRIRDKSVTELGKGELFGWSAITAPYHFTAAAWATRDSHVYTILGDDLLDIFKKNNHVGYVVMQGIASLISSRLKEASAKLVE